MGRQKQINDTEEGEFNFSVTLERYVAVIRYIFYLFLFKSKFLWCPVSLSSLGWQLLITPEKKYVGKVTLFKI